MRRRNFLIKSGMGLTGISLAPWSSHGRIIESSTSVPFRFGVASYSFRNYSLENTLMMVKRLGLNRIALKSMHLPLESTQSELKNKIEMIKQSGVELYGGGVIYMSSKEQVDQAFNYAHWAGMEIIIGVPDHNLLVYTEEKVKETGIRLAIHNHGPGDEKYPSPESIYKRIADLDSRLGICLDIGHAVRIGLNPAEEVEKYRDRLLDIHIKDVTAASAEGDTIEIGRGVINIPLFLKTLIKTGYPGTVSFEFEKDPDDIMPGFAESVGFVNGVLAALK